MERIYVDFGVSLRKARKSARLTQDVLAEKVGLSRTSITNIERGRQHLALHMLYRLAEAVGCKPVELLPDVPRDEDVELSRLLKKSGLGRQGQEWLRAVVSSGSSMKANDDGT
jgi:transcriptional regulator with XRE-family HTH domain